MSKCLLAIPRKDGDIAALGDFDDERVVCALAGVVLAEPPAETAGVDADDWVNTRVEVFRPAEDAWRQNVAFDRVLAAFESLLNDIPQHVAQHLRRSDDGAGENSIQLRLYLVPPDIYIDSHRSSTSLVLLIAAFYRNSPFTTYRRDRIIRDFHPTKKRSEGVQVNDDAFEVSAEADPEVEELLREKEELVQAIKFWRASDADEALDRLAEFEKLLKELDDEIQSLAEWFPDGNQEMNHRNWRLSCREKNIHTVSTCAALPPCR